MRRFGVCLACSHVCALTLQFRTQDAALAHRAAIPSRPCGITTLGSYFMPNPRRSCGVLVCASHVCMPVLWRFNSARNTPLWRIGRLNHRVRTAQQLLAANSYRTRAGHAAFWCVPRMFACLCFCASIPHTRRHSGTSGGYPGASTRHSSSWQQTHAKPAPAMRPAYPRIERSHAETNAAQAQPGICPGASARLNKSIFRSTAPAACVMPLSLRRPR